MSLGDSGALVHAGGAAPADELPPDAWPRYRTKKTIATMTATTKTIMNRSVTQPPPEPQYPLPSHIIAGNHLSQPANQVLTSACPRTQDTKLVRPRPEGGDCLLYTSDAADDLLCVDLGGRRIIKKKK